MGHDDSMSEESVLARILAVDVGAGTQDILIYDSETTIENCVKLVLPSRTVILARRIEEETERGRDVFLTGNLMGGGPITGAVKRHVRAGLAVYATPEAARSLRDNPLEVESLGVRIVGVQPPDTVALQTGDIDLPALRDALARFDVELPDRYAIAVQDHGESIGMSQRRFRFHHWAEFVRSGGLLPSLAYTDNLPAYLTRMAAVRRDAPGALLMDTCIAAVWGALYDEQVAAHRNNGVVVVNVGNQHTLGVLCRDDRILGLFEHHTALMTEEKLALHVEALQSGTIDNEQVYADNGHGAIVHPDYMEVKSESKEAFQFVAVTGPNRQIAKGRGYHFAVPFGDMMLSGCFGLVEAAKGMRWVD